ncbi:MAG: hypothetical protein ABIB46_05010 [bacterium]
MKNYILAILSGILIILSFPNFLTPNFSLYNLFIAWICLIPLLLALEKNSSPFLLGFISGFIASIGKFYWICIFTSKYGIMVILGFLILSLYLSLYTAFFLLFFKTNK